MTIELYEQGFENAKRLIREGSFVDDRGDWGEVNPGTEEENAFIDSEGLGAYALWHLGVRPEDSREDKGAWAFPYGDYRSVHRSALLAAQERATQYGYESIRAAAVELLELLDAAAG